MFVLSVAMIFFVNPVFFSTRIFSCHFRLAVFLICVQYKAFLVLIYIFRQMPENYIELVCDLVLLPKFLNIFFRSP